MIPKAFITHWRQFYNWPMDEQVEQDLILCKILLNLYQDEFLCNELAFRGGTALQKLFFQLPTRYSEDLDLVQINPGPIGKVINKIREIIDPWLGSPTYMRNEGRFTLYYSFLTENEPISKRKIKIEINTREHVAFLGFTNKSFTINNPWIEGTALIKTYYIEKLLATKLRALFQRKKGRDLFDLGIALEMCEIDLSKLLMCFNNYMAPVTVTRALFEKNLHQKILDKAFTSEILSLLPHNSEFSKKYFKYQKDIYEKIIQKLTGNPWKIKFETCLQE